ncbi:hypothetical protein ETC05_15700 [Geobacillus sp. BMUD]|nr:hypothetical protein [Geobacillus sp. BMUD]
MIGPNEAVDQWDEKQNFNYIGCNKEFPISMSRLYHLTSWHGDKKSEQYHGKQNGNLYSSKSKCTILHDICLLVILVY